MDEVTAERLLQALDDQQKILCDVKHLRTSNRLLTGIVTILLAVLLGLSILTVGWIHTAEDAKTAAHSAAVALEQVQQLNVVDAQQLVINNLSRCQVRNSGNVVLRSTFQSVFDAVDSSVTTPQGHQAIANLRAAVPTAAQQDVDCTTPPDGLGADDYLGG